MSTAGDAVVAAASEQHGGANGLEASYAYANKTFEVPLFLKAAGGICFRPETPTGPLEPLGGGPVRLPAEEAGNEQAEEEEGEEEAERDWLGDLHRMWDLSRFGRRRRRAPLVVARSADVAAHCPPTTTTAAAEECFSRWGAPRTLDMPIKFPGSDEYRLPQRLAQFEPWVRAVAALEARLLAQLGVAREADPYYCYLTVDQGVVPPGATQRSGGCHVDGFQGVRVQPKVVAGHSFVVADSLPTVYYLQGFATAHLDEARHNFFLDFDRQARADRAWRPAPYDVVLMDAFQVHRADEHAAASAAPLRRTFLRMSYSVREFDRLGNAHNPLFDYHWDMVPRDIQSTLVTWAEEDAEAAAATTSAAATE